MRVDAIGVKSADLQKTIEFYTLLGFTFPELGSEDEGYDIEKKPWDTFSGQRYAIIKDPDGYLIDLFAQL